jgi:hypothetical protein
MEWAWRLRGCPSGFHQHRAGMTASDLADPPMMGFPESRLAHAWVQAEITHQLLGVGKAAYIADGRH